MHHQFKSEQRNKNRTWCSTHKNWSYKTQHDNVRVCCCCGAACTHEHVDGRGCCCDTTDRRDCGSAVWRGGAQLEGERRGLACGPAATRGLSSAAPATPRSQLAADSARGEREDFLGLMCRIDNLKKPRKSDCSHSDEILRLSITAGPGDPTPAGWLGDAIRVISTHSSTVISAASRRGHGSHPTLKVRHMNVNTTNRSLVRTFGAFFLRTTSSYFF